MKKMSWLSIGKNIKWEKMPDYNYKNVFLFRKLCLFIRASIRNYFLSCLCSLSTDKISRHAALGKIFHYMLNQWLSQSIRIFFILQLYQQLSQSITDFFYFTPWSAAIRKCRKNFSHESTRNFFRVGFVGKNMRNLFQEKILRLGRIFLEKI